MWFYNRSEILIDLKSKINEQRTTLQLEMYDIIIYYKMAGKLNKYSFTNNSEIQRAPFQERKIFLNMNDWYEALSDLFILISFWEYSKGRTSFAH